MDSFNAAASSSVAQNNHPSSPRRPCIRACGFFGSLETFGLCFKCYTDYKWVKHMEWLRETSNVAPSPAALPVVPKKNRCGCCNKKVRLLGFTCRCGGTFCGLHRYAESHTCTFDFKAAGKVAIEKENPVVVADKLKDRA